MSLSRAIAIQRSQPPERWRDAVQALDPPVTREEYDYLRGMVERSNAARRARASDPTTSRNAAIRAGDFADNHAGRILRALQANGPMTADEIGRAAGLTVVQVDRRTIELQRTGALRTTGRTRNGMREWEAA